jgi:hypothetical protein
MAAVLTLINVQLSAHQFVMLGHIAPSSVEKEQFV